MSTQASQLNAQTIVVKIVLIGDSEVGKSCLLARYCDETFSSGCRSIGVDFRSKRFVINGLSYKLQIWDTSGEQKFRTITHTYYRAASGIFIVYDITNSRSFENVELWLQEVERHAKPECVRMVIGNKKDLVGKREVLIEQAQDFAMKNDIPLFETSCKDNVNVKEAFTSMAEECASMVTSIPKSVGNENQEIVVERSSWLDCCFIL